ncbi:hypothetical protein JHK86_022460 [Glycine max]|nr:hypothetical protein JHK86_022460 [Glycine max]
MTESKEATLLEAEKISYHKSEVDFKFLCFLLVSQVKNWEVTHSYFRYLLFFIIIIIIIIISCFRKLEDLMVQLLQQLRL